MTPAQAQRALEGKRTFPVAEASLTRVKELHAQCLAHGIAAAMTRPKRRDGG